MTQCDFNLCFKGINSISDDLLLNNLEANFKMFLDWSFLNIGGWIDAIKPIDTVYGGNNHYRLIPVEDMSYPTGQVWQGVRKDWVWEQGIVYNNTSPLNNNTILVDGDIRTNFIINYPLGRIIFDDPIPTDSLVEFDYSYRYVQVHRSSESPWFNLVQYSSFNTANQDIQQIGEGEWAIGSHHRVQLPAIIIESIPRSRSRPYELGNSLLWLEQDVGFYVLAENKNDRNKLLDIIRLQQDSTIQLYNTNMVAQNDVYPLDYNGSIKNPALMYPDLIGQYNWRKCFIKNVNLIELDSPHVNFHQGLARATLEIIST